MVLPMPTLFVVLPDVKETVTGKLCVTVGLCYLYYNITIPSLKTYIYILYKLTFLDKLIKLGTINVDNIKNALKSSHISYCTVSHTTVMKKNVAFSCFLI
jgi:hypothetical protein